MGVSFADQNYSKYYSLSLPQGYGGGGSFSGNRGTFCGQRF